MTVIQSLFLGLLMNDKDKNIDFLHNVKLWPLILGVFLASLGIVLSFFLKTESLTVKIIITVIAELGFAFVIAYVIIITIDSREKYEFRKTVEEKDKKFQKYSQDMQRRLAARNIVSFLLDMDLPQAVTDGLQKSITNSTILKRYQKMVVDFSFISDDKLQSTTLFEYVAENIGNEVVEHPLQIFLENQEVEKIGVEEYFFGVECFDIFIKKKGEVNFLKLDLDYNDRDLFRGNQQTNLEIGSVATLTLAPGDCFKVLFSHSEKKKNSDNAIWQNLLLCERLDLTVNYPRDKLNLYYTMIHPEGDTADVVELPSGLKIDFDKPLFLRHGWLIWWQPK